MGWGLSELGAEWVGGYIGQRFHQCLSYGEVNVRFILGLAALAGGRWILWMFDRALFPAAECFGRGKASL